MMLKYIGGVASVIAMLGLTGCRWKADDRICLTPDSVIAPGDMNACVHKWAYRLAVSPDPAGVVAKAVVRACNDVANSAAEKVGKDEQARQEAYLGNIAVGETEALFRVVQARAGQCDIP